jgi:hypothetical protein
MQTSLAIRFIRNDEYALFEDFLYEAAYVERLGETGCLI